MTPEERKKLRKEERYLKRQISESEKMLDHLNNKLYRLVFSEHERGYWEKHLRVTLSAKEGYEKELKRIKRLL